MTLGAGGFVPQTDGPASGFQRTQHERNST